MKICDLFKYEKTVYIDPSIDTERELEICCDTTFANENTLLFYPRPVGKSAYKLPKLDKKPYAIVTDWHTLEESEDIPIIKVKNARHALSYAYSNLYGIDYDKLKVIGVTGTNGKTSTSTMLERILIESGKGVGYIGTGSIRINGEVCTDGCYSMTTPNPSLLYLALSKMINEGCEYAIMEVSSHALSLCRSAPIKFTLGIFTNLSSDHMDFHKNKDDYFKAKLSLFDNCKIGVFNIDDEYSNKAYNASECQKYSIGVINEADANITGLIKSDLSGSSFFYKEDGLIFKLELKLGGVYNVYNALCAAKSAIALGIKPRIVKNALNSIEKIDGRLEAVSTSPFVIIDYAHTANAFENLLKLLKSNKSFGQNLIVVFGCGGDRDKTKRSIMGAVSEKYADKIIITEDNSRTEKFEAIKDDILSGIKNTEKIHIIEQRQEAIRYAILSCNDNDIVAIVGKGHERYITDMQGTRAFDERSIIKDALEERKNESKA